MLDRLSVFAALALLTLSTASCATAAKDKATSESGTPQSTSFEAWAGGNGTGAFFRAVGPGGGSGVRSGWPQ